MLWSYFNWFDRQSSWLQYVLFAGMVLICTLPMMASRLLSQQIDSAFLRICVTIGGVIGTWILLSTRLYHLMSTKVNTADFFQKWGCTIGLTIAAFVPIWFYLFVRFLASPDGFWQNLILGVLVIWLLGAVQFVLFCIWVYVMIVIWIS